MLFGIEKTDCMAPCATSAALELPNTVIAIDKTLIIKSVIKIFFFWDLEFEFIINEYFTVPKMPQNLKFR
jgi:hypothetical protein